MTRTNIFGTLALAAALLAPGAATLSAQDWRGDWGGYYRGDYRADRHIDRDYDRIERMRADIARDRARLDEDIRCGRERAARHDAADLARDQRRLEAMLRDVHRDQRYENGYYRDSYRDWR